MATVRSISQVAFLKDGFDDSEIMTDHVTVIATRVQGIDSSSLLSSERNV